MKLIIIAVVVLLSTTSYAQWHTNLKESLSIAEKNEQLVLLNFSGSDWCGPCIRLRKEILDNPAFEQMAEASLVLVNADFHDKRCVSKSKALSTQIKQLGDSVRRERMGKGMTQEQLAEFADLNIRNVQRIEAGEIDVLLSTIARIRKALGCPWEKLIPKDWRS